MACWECKGVCVGISEECFCKYQDSEGIRLEHNIPAINYANMQIKSCIGDCQDLICEGDKSMNVVTESDEYKFFYATLIQYSIYCSKGFSRLHKAGAVQFDGDQNFAAVTIAGFNMQKKHLEGLIASYRKQFQEFVDKLGLSCMKKEIDNCHTCHKATCSCECKKYENLDWTGL